MEMRLDFRQEQKMELKLEMKLWWKCDLCKNDRLELPRDAQAHVDKLKLCMNCLERVVFLNLERHELWMLRSINTRRGGKREESRITFKDYQKWYELHPEKKALLGFAGQMIDLYRLGYRSVP